MIQFTVVPAMTRGNVAGRLPHAARNRDRNQSDFVYTSDKDGVHIHGEPSSNACVAQIIQCLQQDLVDITRFYNISTSQRRAERMKIRLSDTLHELQSVAFSELDQNGKVDYLLLQSFINRKLQQLKFEDKKLNSIGVFLKEWASVIEDFCQQREEVADIHWQQAADQLSKACTSVKLIIADVNAKRVEWDGTPSLADRATRVINEFGNHLQEAFKFYQGYHPLATWWLEQPCQSLLEQLEDLRSAIKIHLVGVEPGDQDAIIGDPIGRESLLADIRSEFLSYSPEELIEIGEQEYRWCETEMRRASAELGYDRDWRKALEHVKNMFPAPGEQPMVVQKLAREAATYVKDADLVTVPPICEETRRTLMMTPERQKANPFFLGGTNLIVSYPTNEMNHESKMMSMRGNSVPFSKATVFHELIPGHHLQYHYISRYNIYRRSLFDTPFWMEGWALYWEFIFWERGDFFSTPEERIGTLFWRMHRCARIIFSVKFHLGQMTPQECVDYLVAKVGHERATAEGEVRRSFNGDYRPLYQAGYMLGALQLRQLRHMLVDSRKVPEKDFHDQILKANEMPIDMLRALLTNVDLSATYKPTWKFYDKRWHSWT